MEQVALGDAVVRTGPHLSGIPRQVVEMEEARVADQAEALAEDLAVDQAADPAMDEGADEDPLGPERAIRLSKSWRGCPSAWCRRTTPRDGEESTTGTSSSESDASCPKSIWGPRSRNS